MELRVLKSKTDEFLIKHLNNDQVRKAADALSLPRPNRCNHHANRHNSRNEFPKNDENALNPPPVVLLFTVIVLIGTGWSFLKPFLQEREKKVLMIVIPLQVLANIASVVIGEMGPFIKDWVTWNQVFLLVDIICCCAIIFPIVWSIRSLRETSKTDGKAARNLAKLTLFRQFYIVVIGYLYFTRIVVFALRTIAAYKYQWVSNAAEETATLAFYLVIFYMFRPVEKNEYFVLDDDDEDEEAAELALRDEEFEL
ncbi:protein GPR107-like [Durio zibethinus]|uniref:Protein GPR107-like n=1 Tax=Durio zibethinus TaxID=66656 RepID=A0A6P5Z725_DURZI|nr:protein GPR107-like [Durio zibethinus]